MKPLIQLTNVERAKLLFELHPGAINNFLLYSKERVKNGLTTEAKEGLIKDWKNGLITAKYWIALLEDVQATLLKYGTQLSKSKNLFSDQLFDGLKALVMSTLLADYTKTQDNQKFNQTVNLLFT